MINKKSMWFLTLFSLVLVLSIYYITMPNDLLSKKNTSSEEESVSVSNTDVDTEEVVEESDVIDALRVALVEEREDSKKKLESIMTDNNVTSEEKNNAYEELQTLNTITGEESTLEKKIKESFGYPVFIKIDGNTITCVLKNDKHDVKLANEIMNSIQKEFKERMIITIQFK